MKFLEIDEDLMKLYFQIYRLDESRSKGLFDYLVKNGGWALTALAKHFDAVEIQHDYKCIIMINSLADGAIGRMVKYFKDCWDWAKANNQTKVTLEDMFVRVYPAGFPDFTKD